MNITPHAPDAAREIVTSRQIAAPRELVWQVWTNPAHVTKWWGPHGFSTTTSEFNLSNGGTWRFVMHGPDGIDYPNKVVFLDIDEPNYLNYKHVGEDDFAHILFEAIVTFEPRDGGTFITLRTIFPTAQERDYVVENHGAIEGARNTLERFEAVVKEFTGR